MDGEHVAAVQYVAALYDRDAWIIQQRGDTSLGLAPVDQEGIGDPATMVLAA